MLICDACKKSIGECFCEGADKRAKEIAFTPGHKIATKWCRNCDRHHARCKCEQPDFFIVMGGEEIDVSKGLKTLDEKIIKPNLKMR